tara:strand:+ start:713 stop:1759 length:1047 start_codon:yes stop_codon:yes gene_type:complete
MPRSRRSSKYAPQRRQRYVIISDDEDELDGFGTSSSKRQDSRASHSRVADGSRRKISPMTRRRKKRSRTDFEDDDDFPQRPATKRRIGGNRRISRSIDENDEPIDADDSGDYVSSDVPSDESEDESSSDESEGEIEIYYEKKYETDSDVEDYKDEESHYCQSRCKKSEICDHCQETSRKESKQSSFTFEKNKFAVNYSEMKTKALKALESAFGSVDRVRRVQMLHDPSFEPDFKPDIVPFTRIDKPMFYDKKYNGIYGKYLKSFVKDGQCTRQGCTRPVKLSVIYAYSNANGDFTRFYSPKFCGSHSGRLVDPVEKLPEKITCTIGHTALELRCLEGIIELDLSQKSY